MEAQQLRKAVENLIGDYVGLKLREKSFDPRGRGHATGLDHLAHYDLAVSAALWWLDREGQGDGLDRHVLAAPWRHGAASFPNRSEREAMILASLAGIVMDSLPVEDILSLYRRKPVASFPRQQSKASMICPFTLSCHPLAMLASCQAVRHCRRQNLKLKRWLSERAAAMATPGEQPSSSSSSSSSSSGPLLRGAAGLYEDSEDPVQD